MVIWDGIFPPIVDATTESDAGRLHASLSYDSIVSQGPPARPLEFPGMMVVVCVFCDYFSSS